MKVINLWGGPGAGKSSTAAGLFHEMKYAGKRVELVTEFPKELVYEQSFTNLNNQLRVLAEQDHRLRRLKDRGVDYVITDSPLPLSILYAQPPFDRPWFTEAVIRTWRTYHNLNLVLKRVKPYQEFGRTQGEKEAEHLDKKTLDLLHAQDAPYLMVEGDENAHKKIFDILKKGNH